MPVVGGAVEVLDAHAEVESAREGLHLRLVSLDAHRLHLARAEGLEAHALGHDVLVGLPVALHARGHVAVCVQSSTSW